MRLKVTLLTTLDSIKTSFWFIPLLMVISTISVAIFLVWLDKHSSLSGLKWLEFAYQTEASTIRSLLNTIAGSMITVTSIAFSITIVTLTLASSQFGPRLIRNFMMDRGTQVVLGTFISNFSYCLVLVYVMSLKSYQDSVLGMAILWCLLATFVSVCVLIYFIHHVASAIQADTVIDDVYCELTSSIDQFTTSSSGKSGSQQLAIEHENLSEIKTIEVKSSHSGYVQLVDLKGLLCKAEELDVYIHDIFGPGDFVVQDCIIFNVFSCKKLDDEQVADIASKLTIGSRRTPVQDPEYAVHQIVEIALRALSPGVNDPYTALTCIDKLSAALCDLCHRNLPSGFLEDKHGNCRVSYKTINFSGLGEAAFDQIRQFASGSTAVTIRLLEGLCRIAELAENEEHIQFVKSQTHMVEEKLTDSNLTESDRHDVTKRINAIHSVIATQNSKH